MSNNFVATFEGVLDDISVPKLADTMAKRARPRKNASGISGNLYRLIKKNQVPKPETIIEIADALGVLKNLSTKQTQELQERLLNAARPTDSQIALKSSLRPQCEEVLRKVGTLSELEIASILDRADVGTMRLIVEADDKGEAIVPMRFLMSEKVIPAGRAHIYFEGEVTPAQRKVLEKAAEMIEAVLNV